MRFIYYALFFLALSHHLYAADSESQLWLQHVQSLTPLEAPQEAKEKVLMELAEWGPEKAGSYWKFPLWFRDMYLHDESFRGLVRAYFLPGFMNTCQESFTGASLSCPIDAVVRATEMGFVALRVVHKLPYLLWADERTKVLANIKWQDCAKTCTTMLSHWSALASQTIGTISAGNFAGDPVGYLAAGTTAHVLKAASFLFAGATAYLAMDGDFMDVALRSLKRKYEIQQNWEEFAVVSMMIARKAKNKLKTS